MRLRSAVLLVASFWLLAATPWADAQSLGDIAQKEAERRKTVKSGSTKVYTNRDLGSGALAAPFPAAVSPIASDDPEPAEDDAEPEAAQPSERGDQESWRKRMTDLETTLQRNLTYVEALQSRINALTVDFVNRDDPAQRSTIEADRQKAIAELERLNTQIQNDRKAVADLQDEARRAGVPPGWLR